jgi:hypothetical protein
MAVVRGAAASLTMALEDRVGDAGIDIDAEDNGDA